MDFNTSADSWNQPNDIRGTEQYPEMYKFMESYGGEAELIVNIHSMALAGGVELLYDEQSVQHTVTTTFTTKKQYSNLLSSELWFVRLYYNLMSTNFARLYAGVGYEEHQLTFKDALKTNYSRVPASLSDQFIHESRLKTTAPGGSGVAGLEFKLFKGVWIYGQAKYRWMQTQGLTGKTIYREHSGDLIQEQVYENETLYFIEESFDDGASLKSLGSHSSPPDWETVDKTREAIIDLTGYGYTVGLTLRLF